jgi:hypothetical protein
MIGYSEISGRPIRDTFRKKDKGVRLFLAIPPITHVFSCVLVCDVTRHPPTVNKALDDPILLLRELFQFFRQKPFCCFGSVNSHKPNHSFRMNETFILTLYSGVLSCSTTTFRPLTQALRTFSKVLPARLIPSLTASSKLTGDDAMIPVTLATDMVLLLDYSRGRGLIYS